VRRSLAVIAVNLVVFCAAAELVALAVYYYQHGWLFYMAPYRRHYELIEETRGDQLTASGLHPYFGPIHRPGIPFDVPEALRRSASTPRHQTNNFGFVSPYDYPVARTSDRQFFVGVFGGSVANWFCEVGAARLLEDLRRQPFFAAKDLVPICLSHEGYKQPQQALVLTYFLAVGQPLDLVINIDGFNEVALGNLNEQRGWDLSMPSVMHLDPLINVVNQATLTPEKLQTLAAIETDKQRLNRLAGWINATHLASVDVVLERYYAAVEQGYHEKQQRFQQLPSSPPENSVVHVTPSVRARRGDEVFSDAAKNWAAASVLMHDTLEARGVAYFHVLQPNQYYGTRRFSEGEAKVALSDQSLFKPGAEKGYPWLEKELLATQASHPGMHLLNGVHLFDALSEAVYMDNCCHYTLAGNDLLADFLARSILAAPGPWRN